MGDLQTVIFDLDGVLVDSWGLACSVLTGLCHDHGMQHADLDRFRSLHGRPLAEILATLALPADFGPKFVEAAARRIDEVKPFAGVLPILEQLRSRGCAMGVLTG